VPLIQVDLTRQLEPLDWYLEELILKGFLNLIASLPGHGKTAMLTALAWQASRPNGGEFLGRHVGPGKTIFVDYDAPGDGRSVRFWLDKHRAAYPDGDISKIIVLEPDPDTFGMGIDEVKQLGDLARATGVNLIVVDSFMAAFPGADPVKLTAVQGPLWYMRRLATETGAAVILIDHLPKPMSGEKAGARGVMGSIAKPAQSRTVHLLTRVPAKEVQGRNVLRWDVSKLSFAALPEPFGLELNFNADAVRVEETELPESYGETKTERALRAMQSVLETRRGTVIERKELLEVAIREGNVQHRAAASALKELVERLGNTLLVVQLPGRGQPVGYRLKDDEDQPKPTASEHQTVETPPDTDEVLLHTPLHQNTELPQKDEPSVVRELRRRFETGEFIGQSMKLPVGRTDDLDKVLGSYFKKRRLPDGEAYDLEAIARVVVGKPETGMLGRTRHKPLIAESA